jgi:hypothetical protein
MQARGAKLAELVPAVQEKIAKAALAYAKEMSSGGITLAAMKAAGHPYSRRNPRPVGRKYPARINKQSGTYYGAWRRQTHAGRGVGWQLTTTIYNNSREARYLTGKGTSKMVGRPILEDVAKHMRPIVQKLEREGQKKVHRLIT